MLRAFDFGAGCHEFEPRVNILEEMRTGECQRGEMSTGDMPMGGNADDWKRQPGGNAYGENQLTGCRLTGVVPKERAECLVFV